MRGMTDAALFGILVYDGVECIDLGATHGVLSMAQRVLPNIQALVVGERRGPVQLANGLTVIADRGFDDCPELDVLIVCGGPGWSQQARNPRVLEFIQARGGRDLTASVCTGAMILAAAGVLNGRRATTRRRAIGAEPASPLGLLRERHPEVRTIEARLIDQGSVVTGGGVSLAIDTTLHVLEKLYGRGVADDIAETIEYANARRANKAAFETAERLA